MNFITKFFHELFSPHCPHCEKLKIQEIEQREMNREISNICQSCESLKMQLSIVNQQNNTLLNKLVKEPEEKLVLQNESTPKVLQTRHIPWTVRKQQLEQQSRELAASLKQAATPDKKIEELEKELGISDGTRTESA